MTVSMALASACTNSRAPASAPGPTTPAKASPASQAACTVRGQHAADVYSAMLTAEARELPTTDIAYVVDSAVIGLPAASHPGPKFTADVAQCIARGLGRFGHVALVMSNSDPRIPLRKSGGPIGIVKGGFVVVFGSVPSRVGRTQVSVNTGGGFGFRGGEFCVSQPKGSAAQVVPCGSSWIS